MNTNFKGTESNYIYHIVYILDNYIDYLIEICTLIFIKLVLNKGAKSLK